MNAGEGVNHVSDQSPLVLLVDDDPSASHLVAQTLRQDGYRMAFAASGADALQACAQMPAIILIKASLPEMDGFTCCRQLRLKGGSQCPPMLMIVGLGDQEAVNQAYRAGADDFISQPFHWTVLRQRVRRTLTAYLDRKSLQQTIEKERLLRQELKRANERLHHLATTDGLTGIFNRRVFDEQLEREWRRLKRERLPLGLILFDVDCFKAYNDTHGHLGGDQCLKQVAQIIQRTIRRPADLAARYGGEEFAVVLPNTKFEGVIHIAEKVQQRLREQQIPHGASPVKPWVTMSIGLSAMVPQSDSSPQTLISIADKALYCAKASGRDRIIAHDDISDPTPPPCSSRRRSA